MIRVLIVAPSTVMRSGLEALIASSPGMELVGVYPDLSESESLQPDVVLSTIAPQDVSPPMVLLSSEAQPAWTQDLVRLGVRADAAGGAVQVHGEGFGVTFVQPGLDQVVGEVAAGGDEERAGAHRDVRDLEL